jgi:NUMOD4 motif
MTEIWRPLPGYENLYEISSHARIRSLERKVWVTRCSSRGHFRIVREHMLRPFRHHGRFVIAVCKNGIQEQQTVKHWHRRAFGDEVLANRIRPTMRTFVETFKSSGLVRSNPVRAFKNAMASAGVEL